MASSTLLHQKTIFTVFDQFRHAAPSKAITGVPQAMDSITDRPKGSSNCMGCNSAQGLAEQPVALNGPDTADINHLVVVYVRGDILIIVSLILDDARQYQLFIAGPGDFNSLPGTLVIVNAPEKKQVIVRVRLKIKLPDINAVMDGFDIIKIRRSIGIADGNIKRLPLYFL
jgi:hypothetical protein